MAWSYDNRCWLGKGVENKYHKTTKRQRQTAILERKLSMHLITSILFIGRQRLSLEKTPISNRNDTNGMFLKYFFPCSTFTTYLKHIFKISTAWYFHSFIEEPMNKLSASWHYIMWNLDVWKCLNVLHSRNIHYKKNKKMWMFHIGGKLFFSFYKSWFQRVDDFKYSKSSRGKQWVLRNPMLSYFYCIIMLTEEKEKRPMNQSHITFQIHKSTAYKGCKEGK